MKQLLTLVILAVLTLGCGQSGKTLLPNVSGKAGEVIVVMDKDNWEGNLGAQTRDLLTQDCPFLPQREPMYNLVSITPGAFGDLFKVHRNIVFFHIEPAVKDNGITYRNDVWAHPQCVIQINAANADSALALVNRSSEMILGALEQAERDRIITNTLLYEEKSIAPQIADIFGGEVHFPSGYKLRKKTDNFAWVAYQKQYSNQVVLIYKYPVGDDPDPFSCESLVAHRNEILKENVPGMFENTYMTTSTFMTPQVRFLRYKGRDFAEMRGLWEVENDYMGGPFVLHAFYSKDGQDIIVLDAFVYAPKYDKRHYLRQVESLLYSFEWEETAEKDEKKG